MSRLEQSQMALAIFYLMNNKTRLDWTYNYQLNQTLCDDKNEKINNITLHKNNSLTVNVIKNCEIFFEGIHQTYLQYVFFIERLSNHILFISWHNSQRSKHAQGIGDVKWLFYWSIVKHWTILRSSTCTQVNDRYKPCSLSTF